MTPEDQEIIISAMLVCLESQEGLTSRGKPLTSYLEETTGIGITASERDELYKFAVLRRDQVEETQEGGDLEETLEVATPPKVSEVQSELDVWKLIGGTNGKRKPTFSGFCNKARSKGCLLDFEEMQRQYNRPV